MRYGKLAVPGDDDPTLRTRILHEIYGRLPSAHPRHNKTYVLARSKYWWPRIASDVDRYVANYTTYKASKVLRDKIPGLLHPLPVPPRP